MSNSSGYLANFLGAVRLQSNGTDLEPRPTINFASATDDPTNDRINVAAVSSVAIGAVTGMGTGVGTWLTTPSGANLAALLTSALPASKGGTGLTAIHADALSFLGDNGLDSPTVSGVVTAPLGVSGTAEVQSTSATKVTSSTTPTVIASYTMVDESAIDVAFVVSMKGAAGVAKFGSWDGKATYERHGAAAPAAVGTADYGTPRRTVAGDLVAFDVSGNVVRVIGTAADTDVRNWSVELRVQETLVPAAAPTITTITPDTGTHLGGTSVALVGTGYQPGCACSVDGGAQVAATFTSSTNIAFATVAHAAGGPYTLRVTNPDGQFVDAAVAYQYT